MKSHRAITLSIALIVAPSIANAHDDEVHKLVASNGAAGDFFGRSVAIDGSVLVAGAPNHAGSGAAYVFHNEGEDFVEETILMPLDLGAGDRFGQSVAIFDHVIVVGAPGHAGTGAAYIFEEDGGVWSQVAKLLPAGLVAGDEFGLSVAVFEHDAIVGAPGAPGSAGSAYVFEEDLGVWSLEEQIYALDGSTNARFGYSVAIIHEQAVVGALAQDGVVAKSGAAYVFDLVDDEWVQSVKLQAADGGLGDFFGISVDINEQGWLHVGASGDDDTFGGTGGLNSGSAYAYRNQSGSWVLKHKRVGLSPGDNLGTSVSASYNYSVTGARGFDSPMVGANTGAMILWNVSSPLLEQIFIASDQAPGSLLGGAVDASPCLLVAGANNDDELGENAGAVYVFATLEGAANLLNGSGVNPLAMASDELPNIGMEGHIDVDTTGYPTAAVTQVFLHKKLRATPQVTALGEILVDRSSTLILATYEMGAGVIAHHYTIPNDPSLIGFQFGAQGVIREAPPGLKILAFTNAEQLTIGCSVEGGHHEEEEE